MFSVFKNKEEKQALRERVKEIRAHFTGEELAIGREHFLLCQYGQ